MNRVPPSQPAGTGRDLAAGLLVLVTLAWSYWPTISELVSFWQSNDDYSIGQLVPFVAAFFVWLRRRELAGVPRSACAWGGAVLLAVQLLRLAGLYYDYASLERLSLVGSIAAACWLLYGGGLTRKLAWILAFLLLMVPLPNQVHRVVNDNLQGLATTSAVFSLELLGYWVQRSGNVLLLDGRTEVAVEEACNGLRMLTAFVFTAGTLALLVRRPRVRSTVLVASSIPIAVLANSLRLVMTVIVMHYSDSSAANLFFHDFAGLLMMPIAIAVLLAELRLLDWIATDPPHRATGRGPARAAVVHAK